MKLIIKGFQVLFALFLVYFAGLLLHYHYYLINDPYPVSYREGASMATTTMLLHHVNPYVFLLEPQYTNVYGIVYPLICYPFASLMGDTLLVHRSITAFFIFASCLVIFLVLYKKKTPLLLNFWAILALYACFLYPLTTTPCVDPASTGLFFMLLTIFIPYFFNYSYASLVISVICGVLAFYTKPYFVLGLALMASYLFLFISKKRSILFGFCSLLCFIFSVIFMVHVAPSYFDDCFFIHYNFVFKNCMTPVLMRQLNEFLSLNKATLFLLSAVFVYGLWYWFKSKKFKSIRQVLKGLLTSFKWKDWKAPLIIKQMPLEIYAGIFFAVVLILLMGKKPGANLWYFFQLFSPFGVIFIAWLTGLFKSWPVVLSFLLVLNLFSLTADDDYKYFDKNALGMIGWQEIQMLVKSQVTIFNSPLIAPLLIQEKKELFDDGHTEYFPQGGKRQGFLGHFFGQDIKDFTATLIYINKLTDMMKDKKFDLIIIEAGYCSQVTPGNFLRYYKYIDSILVNAPQDRMPYVMTIWRPI